MTILAWLAIVAIVAVVILAALPLSRYMIAVLAGERTILAPVLAPLESWFYSLAGIDPKHEQGWRSYALALLTFSAVHLVFLYGLLRFQGFLPLDPQGFGPVNPDLAFNTSLSFVTNTNWQNYGGEQTLSHLTQMLGLTVHNFLSAAAGLGIAFAVARAFTRSETKHLRNFWVDMTRAALYILLPLSIVGALALVLCGTPQTLLGSVEATTLEGAKQIISLGPVASQEVVKQLGTNGGGFFNANSAHPLEDPNVPSYLVAIIFLLLLPFATVLAFGRLVGDMRQGRAILISMGIVLLVGVATIYGAESAGNPLLTALGVDPAQGNMEGKEIRFGQALSALFTAATTGTSTGAVVAMHDSLTALGGLVPLFNMLLGCISLQPREDSRRAEFIETPGTPSWEGIKGRRPSPLNRAWKSLPRDEDANSESWRFKEFVSASGHGMPRSLAKLYAGLANGGAVEGKTILSAPMLAEVIAQQWDAIEVMTQRRFRYSTGFMLSCPPFPVGGQPRNFGHAGVGGAVSFGDPEHGIGFCYAPNHMAPYGDAGPYATRLIEALYTVV